MTDDSGLLYLLQVTSAAFPSGSFAHSAGFETLLADGTIVDRKTLRTYADQWLELSVAPSEGVAACLAHNARGVNDLETLLALDCTLTALKSGKEAYDASVTTGRATLRAIAGAFGDCTATYADAVQRNCAAGHAAVVFGVCAQERGVDRYTALSAYLFTAYANLVGVVGRLLPLGQRDVQGLLADCHPLVHQCTNRAETMNIDEICSMTPLLEIAGMRHERLTTRLCIS